MPKITSVDALIDRVKEAYPGKESLLDYVRDAMARECYAGVYDALNVTNYNRYRTNPMSFSSERILKILDDSGVVKPKRLKKLIEAAREDVDLCDMNSRLLPIREQLQDDFDESYEFHWVSEF